MSWGVWDRNRSGRERRQREDVEFWWPFGGLNGAVKGRGAYSDKRECGRPAEGEEREERMGFAQCLKGRDVFYGTAVV